MKKDHEKTREELLREIEALRANVHHMKGHSGQSTGGEKLKADFNGWNHCLFNDVQKLVHIGVWEWEIEKDQVIWSEELFRIAGLDPGQPAPSYAEQGNLYTPQTWPLLNQAIGNALKTGEPYQLELEMCRPDRSTRDVVVFGGARYNQSHDTIIGLYGLVQDVTERKQTENALQGSESNFKKVINTMTETLSVISGDGDFLFANTKAAMNLAGGSPEDVVGRNIKEFVPQEQAEKLISDYQQVIKSKLPINEEKKLRFHAGEKWFINTLQYIQWGPGQIPAVLSISLDISGRVKAEAALRKSEERNRLLSSVTMEGILIHRNGIAIDVNQSLVRILGYPYEEMLHKDVKEVIHPDDLKIVHENIIKEYAFPYEVRAFRKNGEMIHIEIESKNYHYQDEQWRVSAMRDVTDRKKGEELQRTMAAMLDIAPNSITVHDTSGRFLYANKRTFEIHGYSEAEFMAINLHVLDVPESEALLDERFQQIALSGFASFEVAHYHKDGHTFPLEVMAKTVEWRGQAAVLSIATDISARKHAEAEIQKAKEQAGESEERFRNYIQNSPTAVFLVDKNGKFTFVNEAACKLLGYSQAEMLALSIQDLTRSDESSEGMVHFLDLQHRGDIRDVEKKLYGKDGQSIEVLIDGKKLSENEYIGFVKDITGRREAERALRESEEKMRSIYAVVPAGIGVIVNRIIKEVNPLICEMTGYSRDEFMEKDARMLYPSQEEYEYVGIEKYRQMREQGTGRVETRWQKKDGTIMHILLASTPVDQDDFSKGVIFTALDITDRKQTENEIKAALEKAEESDRLKSAFLANMSHEIRTPMNGILGFAELLKEPNLSGDKQKEYIQIIEKSGARMLSTINEIIDISKIEAGLVEIDTSEVNLDALMDFTYHFFKPEAQAKGITLTFHGGTQAQETQVHTDKEKLHAILFNLIKNAIKFTRSGTIDFGYHVKPGSPASTSRQQVLEFFVKDTGIGIPANRQEAIFERFIQADVLDTHAFQGAGLGLSISRAYVDMLGGRIWVESEEGKGATFYFTLPYPPAQQGGEAFPGQEITEAAQVQLQTDSLMPKILLVEDDETSRMYLREALEPNSREILIATTGLQAIACCREHPDIDLVLMDIRMPEMDGYEAIRHIRGFNKDLVIIAQTAHGLAGDREKALEAGCNDYIAKPIRRDELLALIQKNFNK